MADHLPLPEPSWYMSLIQGTTAVPKSIAKLIETAGEQIGFFLEPIHIRRKGQAEADVTIAKAKAEADIAVVQLENRLALQDIQDRADERIRRRETKRQQNMEAITAQAAQILLPQSVSQEPVDGDWVTQFFNYSQDISNEEMQSLWARLLAGEVAKPGSFSLRTLNVVSVMSRRDADMFTRFCSMLWETPEGLTPIMSEQGYGGSIEGVQLDLMDLVHLDTLGLVRFDPFVMHTLTVSSDRRFVCSYYGQPYILTTQNRQDIRVGNCVLTEVAKELAVIAGSTPNEEYLRWALSHLQEDRKIKRPFPPPAAPAVRDSPAPQDSGRTDRGTGACAGRGWPALPGGG
jgi:hypothetical protein